MKVSAVQPLDLARTLQARLAAVFGPRMRGLVVYGSHARGEARGDSDLDLLVLLDEIEDVWRDRDLISPLVAELSLEHDVVISALPIAERDFSSAQTPLLCNARREGLLLR